MAEEELLLDKTGEEDELDLYNNLTFTSSGKSLNEANTYLNAVLVMFCMHAKALHPE